MLLDLTSLRKAISSLESALDFACSKEKLSGLSESQRRVVRAGVIQNFEFTYELCWKFMKRWLENNLGGVYVDGVSRRELFRLAAEHQLIDDAERWMFYHQWRNETAHIYDEVIAQEVFEAAIPFLDDAKIFLKRLESKND